MRRPRAALAAALAALAAPPAAPARANPADAFGFGARAPGMGGAHTAAAADTSANYYNPGILASLDDIHLDVGYQLADPRLTVNGLDAGVDTARGLAIGLSSPGRIGPVQVALGVGLFLPDERVTRTRTLASDQPRFQLFDNRPQRTFLAANVAVELTPRLFVGGGIAYMSATSGAVELAGRLGFPDETDSELALAIDVDLRTIRYPQLGALYRALPWLDLGASYRGGFVLEVDLDFRLAGQVGAAGAEPVIEDGFFALSSVYQDLFQPAQVTAGALARLTPSLRLAFDVGWHRWSAFENPAAVIDIDFDLEDFDSLVDIPDAPPLPAPHFADVLVPRVGVEWDAARTRRSAWTARAGYVLEPSPAPEQSGDTNHIDGDKHTWSAGLGVTLAGVTEVLPRPVSIDAYAALTWLPERAHRKLSPVDWFGDYRAGGRIVQFGLGSRWRF